MTFYNKEALLNIFGVVIAFIAITIMIWIISPTLISPLIVKHKAKYHSNIKAGGCLRQKGKSKHGVALYSLNGQMSKRMWHLTVKDFPFHKKWSKFNQNFDVNFDEKYSKECFRVKYVSTKFLWLDIDFIYDTE